MELTYNSPFGQQHAPDGELDYRFTTQMQVLPKAMPYPEMMLAPVHRFSSKPTVLTQ